MSDLLKKLEKLKLFNPNKAVRLLIKENKGLEYRIEYLESKVGCLKRDVLQMSNCINSVDTTAHLYVDCAKDKDAIELFRVDGFNGLKQWFTRYEDIIERAKEEVRK